MWVDEPLLRQIVSDVCQSLLGLKLHPAPGSTHTAGHLVASVEIRGGGHAVVDVFAEQSLAEALAEAMFGAGRGSLSRDEIRDAFGEIANVIGGNVKGLLSDHEELSLPIVGEAPDVAVHSIGTMVRAAFECCGQALTVVYRESSTVAKLPSKYACVT